MRQLAPSLIKTMVWVSFLNLTMMTG